MSQGRFWILVSLFHLFATRMVSQIRKKGGNAVILKV